MINWPEMLRHAEGWAAARTPPTGHGLLTFSVRPPSERVSPSAGSERVASSVRCRDLKNIHRQSVNQENVGRYA
jgi:hypothetical protein